MNKYNAKILVVEDDRVMKKSLLDVLSGEFAVASARDGIEGFAMALREHPNLILLDISMPNLDGMTMMKKLRASGDWGEKVPIILLTNLDVDDKIMSDVTEDQPSFYLLKSEWTPAGVADKIKETLGFIASEMTDII